MNPKYMNSLLIILICRSVGAQITTTIKTEADLNNVNTTKKYVPSKFRIKLKQLKAVSLDILNSRASNSTNQTSSSLSGSKSSKGKSSIIKTYAAGSKKSKKGSSKSSKKQSSSTFQSTSSHANSKIRYNFDIALVSKNSTNTKTNVTSTKTNNTTTYSSNITQTKSTNTSKTKRAPEPTSSSTSPPLFISFVDPTAEIATTTTTNSNTTTQDSSSTTTDEITAISALIGSSNGQDTSQKKVAISGIGIALIIVTLFALSLFGVLFSVFMKHKKRRSKGNEMYKDEETCTSSFKKHEMHSSKNTLPNDLTIDETYSDLDGNITSTNQSSMSSEVDYSMSHDIETIPDVYMFDGDGDGDNEDLQHIDFGNFGKTDETVVF